jgi:hypothetical protein
LRQSIGWRGTHGEDGDEIERLLSETVAALAAARTAGDEAQIVEAIRRYVTAGDAVRMPSLELWDYFAISHPGLPEQAGLAPDEVERADKLLEAITDQFFGGRGDR